MYFHIVIVKQAMHDENITCNYSKIINDTPLLRGFLGTYSKHWCPFDIIKLSYLCKGDIDYINIFKNISTYFKNEILTKSFDKKNIEPISRNIGYDSSYDWGNNDFEPYLRGVEKKLDEASMNTYSIEVLSHFHL
tara:strand:- start:536 stop:940 length:405 start_codon:yes stop_codon:yes gene_type:complete